VVIMTSNAGSADLKRAVQIGFLKSKGENARDEQHEAMRSKALDGLKRIFRPEFINRIDQVVVFHSLGKEELDQILDLLLTQVRTRLSEHRISLEISAEVRELLLREGFDEEYGARPLRRTISEYIDDTLADAVLAGELAPGSTAYLVMHDDKVVLEPQIQSQLA
ncbi:MAG: AAA family ATPase, partial [Ktedonobacteraceae bacterium]